MIDPLILIRDKKKEEEKKKEEDKQKLLQKKQTQNENSKKNQLLNKSTEREGKGNADDANNQTSIEKGHSGEGQSGKQKKVVEDRDLIDQITKVIVKMDLEADGEGNVYFNELLFKTMKMVFGEEHLKNTILIEAEFKALKKIKQIKERILKKQRAEARIQAMTVNPFVLKMLKNVSFKLWLKISRKN